MDKILFGDNQFFAVNHMSEEKARAQAMKFKDTRSIIRVLDSAYDVGVTTFMCTTHDRIEEICDHVRANRKRYKDFKFYPCMPYAHKYADAVTELGMMGALQSFLQGSNIFTLLLQGGMAAAKLDAIETMKVLVDMEMKMFKDLQTPVIFMQNVIVDLLLGLGYKQIFKEYQLYINKRYDAEAGFITMNLPLLANVLNEVGIKDPIVCSNINKIGFRMCGGIDEYKRILREKKIRAIAMSIFASGAIHPQEAIEYVCGIEGVQSIVFGASSRGNIQNTKELIESYWR